LRRDNLFYLSTEERMLGKRAVCRYRTDAIKNAMDNLRHGAQ